MEIWKPILPGYEVSSLGRVKSYQTGEPQILISRLNGSGYLHVSLKIGNKWCLRRVHRLVANAFIPNIESKPEINHINGIKTDNRVENLEWCTRSENMIHAFKTGLKKGMCGEENAQSKLTSTQAEEIRINSAGLTTREFAEKFGVCERVIRNVQRGRTYKNAGGVSRGSMRMRTPDNVRVQICQLYSTGEYSQRKLAKMFGLGCRTICTIIHEGKLPL